jgi:hypothetical protein
MREVCCYAIAIVRRSKAPFNAINPTSNSSVNTWAAPKVVSGVFFGAPASVRPIVFSIVINFLSSTSLGACADRLATPHVCRFGVHVAKTSTTSATWPMRQRSRPGCATGRGSIATLVPPVALLAPGVAVVVIAQGLPEARLVAGEEAQPVLASNFSSLEWAVTFSTYQEGVTRA